MSLRPFRNFLLIIVLIGGNAYAQTQLPKCVLFGFGNCIGTLRFSNGDIYTGEFNYGKPNGKGAFTYVNGDSYNGTIAEGQRHGSGTYTSAAGDKYVGQFSEGKFEGVGTYYFLANNRSTGDVYAGEFSSNTFNGQGRYTHSNGQVFVGSFVNGRKAVPIVAPETLLAQAEVHRLAEENAKQKAQLESQLEAERRERLAREKQAAAVLVAQVEAQRIAEENAKQKAQLESQLEAERRERLARDKEAVAAAVTKQGVQVAPIASPAVSIVVVPAGDKAATQPLVVLAKSESVPGNIEPVGKDSESKDSAVKAPLAAELREPESPGGDYFDSGRLFVKGSVSFINNYQVKQSYVTLDLASAPQDPALSVGIGYKLGQNYGVELAYKYIGKQKWNDYPITYKANAYLVGGYFEIPLSYGIALVGRGGLSRTDHTVSGTSISTTYINGTLISSTSTTTDYSYQKTASYFGVGASFALTKNHQITFDFTRLSAGLYTNALYDINLDVLDLGWKYNF